MSTNFDSDQDVDMYGRSRKQFKRWKKEEDNKLIFLVNRCKSNWKEIGRMMGKQPKSCRERWVNQLDPTINRDPFTLEEEWRLFLGVQFYGSKWCQISTMFQNRPDKQIKNYWNTSKMKAKSEEFKQRIKEIFLTKCLQQIRFAKETSF